MRESGQISGFVTLPIVTPLWLSETIAADPNSLMARLLSLIPFTSPVTMIMRLAQGPVPLAQLLRSTGLLALTIVGTVWLAARLFRGTTLLAGGRPTPRALWRALRTS